MNTFLPFNDLILSAESLDDKRLNKQILECKQIHDALTGKSKGYQFHPATMMWRDAEGSLALFAYECCLQFHRRTNKAHKYHVWAYDNSGGGRATLQTRPWWWGDQYFHHSNQQMLVWKDPVYYGRRWHVADSEVPTERPHYIWPVSKHNWDFVSNGYIIIMKSKPTKIKASLDPITMLTSQILVGSNWARYLLQPKG